MEQNRKPEIDARALVRKLSKESIAHTQREIIAPLLLHGRIRTRLGGMIYEFKSSRQMYGWGRFRPINEREAEPLAEALPWERGAYLELFPALRMLLLWPDPHPEQPGTWWAIPFNESDARQRFGFAGEPRPVFLCDPTNGADCFEQVIARVDGHTLWFDGQDVRADPTHAEWLRDAAAKSEEIDHFLPGLAGSARRALLYWQIRQIETAHVQLAATEREQQNATRHQSRQQQLAWLHQARTRGELEGRLHHALAKAEATLHSYSVAPHADGSPGHIVVEWSARGQRYRYRSTIDAQLAVVSSGICLSGRDRDFDLTSLVKVMTDSPSWSRGQDDFEE